MFLTEKPNYPSSFDSFNKQKKKEFDLISQSFDESILRRLNALCNSHSSVTINFSWLSSALAFLSFTHNQAITLLSNPKLTDSLNFYLDDSVKLLDICNSIASEIERLRHRRLLLKLALHLFNNNNNSEDAEKLRRARASLTDWDNNLKGPRYESSKNLEHLVIDLAFMLKEVPRGKISSDERIVRRTIHSVGLVTVFVAGVVVAALRGSTELGVAVRAPSEFLWADSFNILNSAISAESGKKRHLLEELDDVEARLREVIGVMDDAGGEKGGSLNGAVKELERVTETLGEGLERLSNGVNEVFNTVMSSRKEMLERMRVGQQKQQTK